MSNHLAIAAVTETLRETLQMDLRAALAPLVPDVKADPPDSYDAIVTTPTVNVYLFQTTVNAAFRNADAPTRTADGTAAVQRPAAALDLHYLLTFLGPEANSTPQRLLARTVATLHARPVLGREAIRSATAGGALAGTDLPDAPERVRVTPVTLSLEELGRLWGLFGAKPYRLSAVYKAGAVLLEADEPVRTPLQVRERLLGVETLALPVIDSGRVEGPDGSAQPAVIGRTMTLRGRALRGDSTAVRVGEVEIPATDIVTLTPAMIQFRLVQADLRAGVAGVRVVHQRNLGNPATPHAGSSSNLAAFALQPTVTLGPLTRSGVGPFAGTLSVGVSPTVGARQRAELLLNGLDIPADGSAAPAFAFPDPPATVDRTTVVFGFKGVPAGRYLVRVQVDGAASPVDFAARTPQVTIP